MATWDPSRGIWVDERTGAQVPEPPGGAASLGLAPTRPASYAIPTIPSGPPAPYGNGSPVPSSGYDNGPDGLLHQLYDLQVKTRDENVGFVRDNVLPANARADKAGDEAINAKAGNVNDSLNQIRNYQGLNGALAGMGFQNAGAANGRDQEILGQYGTALGATQNFEGGVLGGLGQVYGGMSQLSPTAQTANQQAVLAQQTMAQYQTAQLYQAALARAQANPDDVRAQKEVLALSKKMSEGSLDIQNGGLTPEARDAQLSALNQYGSLTAPKITDDERFIYEQQRLREEQDRGAARKATMSNLRARGMAGGGMELADMQSAGQITAQNRLLGDLGAGAQAQQRAMQALAGYRGLSTDMMQQGNEVARGNANTRLQATGLRGDMANQLAANSQQLSEFNAGQSNQVGMFNAGQANQNAQFNANAYNQNSMFNAGQANNISMYNAGQVNAVGMNNTNQNMIQGRFADQFRADQQNDAAARAQNFANTSLEVSGRQRTDTNNLAQAGFSTNQNAYARTDTAIGNAATLGSRNFTAGQIGVDQTKDYWTDYADTPAKAAQRAAQAAGLLTGVNTQGAAAIGEAGRNYVGYKVGDEQLRAAQYTPPNFGLDPMNLDSTPWSPNKVLGALSQGKNPFA